MDFSFNDSIRAIKKQVIYRWDVRGAANQSTAPSHRTVFFFEMEYWVQLYFTRGLPWRARPGRPEGCIVKSDRGRFSVSRPASHVLRKRRSSARADASERILSTVSGRRIKFAGKFFKRETLRVAGEGRACGSPLRRCDRTFDPTVLKTSISTIPFL